MTSRRGFPRGSLPGAGSRWQGEVRSAPPAAVPHRTGAGYRAAAYASECLARFLSVGQERSHSRAGYRAEIDGLRALAILPVVLFHAGVLGFEGGYVGVDVFFVISGYLITSLIQRELDRGEFSFARFWERRARRILPALIVVVVFSLVAGWFILIPSDLERLGAAAFALSLFASNILFWRESGYFDVDAATKPLLHTWSLAIEEQFYLCFPFALVLLGAIGRSVRVPAIAGALLLSLVLSIYGVANHPAAAFYLLPTRAWELLLGALLALAPPMVSQGRGAAPRDEILSWLGLGAIAAAVFGFHAETPFPGLAALLPCLGTAAIIRSNERRLTSLGRILSTAPFVQLGLISYSLYLWHWPLLVYASYASFEALSPLQISGIIAGSVALAWLSWKFVENPIRRRVLLPTRPRLAAAAATGLLVTGGIGLAAGLTQGYPSRLPADALRYADAATDTDPRREECHATSFDPSAPLEPCRLGAAAPDQTPALMVWGDSHASALLPLFDAMSAEYAIPAAFASYSGCAPIQGVFSPGKQNDDCPEFNKAVLDLAREQGVSHLLLVANWSLYTDGEENGEMAWLIGDDGSRPESPDESRAVFKRRLIETVELLLQQGFTVWIVKQVPLQEFPPPRRLTQVSLYGGDPTSVGRPLSEHIARQSFVNSVFEEIDDPRVHLIDPTPVFCSDDGLCRAARDGQSLYEDEHHVSRFGALEARPIFEPMFRALAKEE